MDMRMLAPALLGAILLGAPVPAASQTVDLRNPPPVGALMAPQIKAPAKSLSQQCRDLRKQLDTAILNNVGAARLDRARKLRAEGASSCAGSDRRAGVTQLQRGLEALRVTPSP